MLLSDSFPTDLNPKGMGPGLWPASLGGRLHRFEGTSSVQATPRHREGPKMLALQKAAVKQRRYAASGHIVQEKPTTLSPPPIDQSSRRILSFGIPVPGAQTPPPPVRAAFPSLLAVVKGPMNWQSQGKVVLLCTPGANHGNTWCGLQAHMPGSAVGSGKDKDGVKHCRYPWFQGKARGISSLPHTPRVTPV